jgi:hypothetical protein
MLLGTIKTLRLKLGENGEPGCSESYACALKKASGVTGRLFDVLTVIKWRKEHPDFNMKTIYPSKKKSETESSPTPPRRYNPRRPELSAAGTSHE